MNINMFPTKGNLIAAKNSLALAKQGYDGQKEKHPGARNDGSCGSGVHHSD